MRPAPRPTRPTLASLAARLDALERRQRIATEADSAAVTPDPQRFWLLEALSRRDRIDRTPGGRVVFAGTAALPDGRTYRWQGELGVAAALADDEWGRLAPALAALGHPVRLSLLRAILNGAHELAALRELPGLGTTGQIYHHLRLLQGAGWVRQDRRNTYVPVPDRVLIALVVIAAVGGAETPPSRGAAGATSRPRPLRRTPR